MSVRNIRWWFCRSSVQGLSARNEIELELGVGWEFAAEDGFEDFGFFGFSDIEIKCVTSGEALGGDGFAGGFFDEDDGSFDVGGPVDIKATADKFRAGRDWAGGNSRSTAGEEEGGDQGGEQERFGGHIGGVKRTATDWQGKSGKLRCKGPSGFSAPPATPGLLHVGRKRPRLAIARVHPFRHPDRYSADPARSIALRFEGWKGNVFCHRA